MFGKYVPPTPIFPSTTKWTDLFVKTGPFTQRTGKPELEEIERGVVLFPGNHHVGTYLYCDGGSGMEGLPYNSFRIKVSETLLAKLKEELIAIDNDTLHYKVIVFPDGINIWVSYGQIIGGRLLASMPVTELPKGFKWGRCKRKLAK